MSGGAHAPVLEGPAIHNIDHQMEDRLAKTIQSDYVNERVWGCVACTTCRSTLETVHWEYGTKWYGWHHGAAVLCRHCVRNIRRPRICNICLAPFRSGNRLFSHLRTAHQQPCP
jgi:hypothetical protein